MATLPLFEPSSYMKAQIMGTKDKFLETQLVAQNLMIDQRKQEVERLKREIEQMEITVNYIKATLKERNPERGTT
jgi:hypothetical protein